MNIHSVLYDSETAIMDVSTPWTYNIPITFFCVYDRIKPSYYKLFVFTFVGDSFRHPLNGKNLCYLFCSDQKSTSIKETKKEDFY